jgi:hypothetical protein
MENRVDVKVILLLPEAHLDVATMHSCTIIVATLKRQRTDIFTTLAFVGLPINLVST